MRLRATIETGVLLLAAPVSATLPYDSFQIGTGEAVVQTLLHGALTRETDDIVAFTLEDKTRRWRVYSFDEGRWQLRHAADVDDDVIFADVIELGGQDRLLVYRRGHVERLDPATWTREPLVSAPSIYNVPSATVPHVDIGWDVNDDGLDDIVLADFDGYWLWLQQPGGALGEPTKLAADPTAHFRFRSATYRLRTIYQLDYDGDGRGDLAFWNRDRFLIYRGGEVGFDPAPLELVPPIAFDTDDVTVSVSVGFGPDADSEPRVMLYGLEDYNGDGIGDIATTSMAIKGLFDQSTRYDFHFGRRSEGKTVFEGEPDTAISSDGIQSPYATGDFNNDGRTDFAMGGAKLGIGKIIAALLTRSFSFDIDFYPLTDDGYPEEPRVSRRVKVRFSLAGDVSANWTQLVEATGDDIKDLLVLADKDRLLVYPGTADARMFAEDPLSIEVDLPKSATPRAMTDLNGDGRDDLIFDFPATGENDTNRLIVVQSR